jgi:hypothetical protein
MSHLKELDQERMTVLCRHSLKMFAEGYGMMFDKTFSSALISEEKVPASQLVTDFSGILAINQIVCSGPATGTFMIILDKQALFTLGGATIMLPQPRIVETCLKGTAEDAELMSDSVGEIGNLLVGELSITFRIGAEDASGLGDTQRLLLKLPVSVGKVTFQPETDITHYNLLTFKMTLGGFDPFQLRIALPTVE